MGGGQAWFEVQIVYIYTQVDTCIDNTLVIPPLYCIELHMEIKLVYGSCVYM